MPSDAPTLTVGERTYLLAGPIVVVPRDATQPTVHSHDVAWVDAQPDGTRIFGYVAPTRLEPGQLDPRD